MGAKFNVADLFGAPGGLALGFRMTGCYNILACVDSDPAAAATYMENFPETTVIIDEIENVTAARILDETGADEGDIDIVIGGPPCPGFSVVGRVKIASLAGTGRWQNLNNSHPRFIDDTRNGLYKHFVKIVKGLRPKYFVMENVFGMASHNGGGTVRQIVKDFGKIGYKTDSRVLNAVEHGVPQERKRIFFIGSSVGLPNPFPELRYSSTSGKNISDKKLEAAVTVWDVIGDLPRLRPGEGVEKAKYGRKPFRSYQKWARGRRKYVFNHVARWHSGRDLKLFAHMREGMRWKDLPSRLKNMYGYRDDVFQDKMKRLRRNRPSWTITAHIAKDGYMYIHPTQDRTITVREAARLQSFPDNFVFCGPRSSQFKQVGNAVPPLLGKAVASAVATALREA